MSARNFVGDLLVRKGVIDDAALARAVEAQSKSPATLGKTLADLGLADESTVARIVAAGDAPGIPGSETCRRGACGRTPHARFLSKAQSDTALAERQQSFSGRVRPVRPNTAYGCRVSNRQEGDCRRRDANNGRADARSGVPRRNCRRRFGLRTTCSTT